jgi:hypothetical protein
MDEADYPERDARGKRKFGRGGKRARRHGDQKDPIPLTLSSIITPISFIAANAAPPLDFPGDAWIMNDVPSQSDPANDRRLISGVFRIRFPPRYRDGMQRVVRNLLNPTGSTITAKNTITFENDNVLALAA